MTLPADYSERVYAGWLGKCIGVRFGAPLENWTYEDIRDNLGELSTYVSEDRGKVFKPDDDTSVPMILIRALEDCGATPDLSAAQIAEAMLDYIGYEHGSVWWGGYGASCEHTAYLNLVHGIPAPRSGSIAQNGVTLAEQIGGQIFSDIWGLVAPNNPTLAADLAERAASISHDGNGLYGARFVAALVSTAFSESDPARLIAAGLAQIPAESEYARVMRAMLDFHAAHPDDWRAAFGYLKANFGYDRYPGIVPIIPNAGVIGLGLLYGAGDFSRAIQVSNMAGWDTDCNVGNVGAIMGVALGLDGIDPAWRDPMNDLLICASVIGTRNLLTIPQCADLFVRLGRALAGQTPQPAAPRYHFRYPGSTQNFVGRGKLGRPIHLLQAEVDGTPVLRTAIRKLSKKGEIRIATRTCYRPSELSGNYYGAAFTPLLYPGQTVTARVSIPANAPHTLRAALFVTDDYRGQTHQGEPVALQPGGWQTLTYPIPAMSDVCLSEVGVVLRNLGEPWEIGAFHLAEMDWSGAPDCTTTFAHNKPEAGAIGEWTYWRGYWRLEDGVYHGSGVGLCETYSGDLAWTDYTLTVDLTPHIGEHHLVLARVLGARRCYAAGLAPDGRIALYKKTGEVREVAAAPFVWEIGRSYTITIAAQSATLRVRVAGEGQTQSLTWTDPEQPYLHGQIGLSTWHGGHTSFQRVRIAPGGGESPA